MQAIITGCGRSGTNLLLEIVRASGIFDFTKEVEDRAFFSRDVLPPKYGTKIAIEWDVMTIENLMRVMDINYRMKLLFSFRHPYDIILSKVYRGRPKSMGGDNMTEEWAKDATIEEAAKYVKKSWDVYQALATKYHDRVKPVRMEDILTNTFNTVKYIASFLSVSTNDEMRNPWKHNRNAYQNRRYHHAIDKKEVNKWKDLKNSYDGYFDNIWKEHLGEINYLIEEQANYFRYELIYLL